MDAAAQGSTPATFARRLPLARLVLGAAAVLLLIFAAGYAARFASANAFNEERAFRVLDEVGVQLDNLQRTLSYQLSLMSDQVAGRACVRALTTPEPDARTQRDAANCERQQAAYLRRLALKGPRVSLARIDEALHARACSESTRGARQYAFVVRAQRPGAPFTAFACDAHAVVNDAGEVRRRLLIAFTGELTETVESFIAQSFFDEVLVTLADGAVIASAPLRAANGSAQQRMRAERGRRLGVKDARAMLRRAQGAGGDARQEKSGADLPMQPAAFTDKIAGERYRVFVTVLSPVHEIYLDANGGKQAQRQERLYLVGLKREDVRAQIAGAVEPAGRFGLTVLVLLALLAWPLANLRAKAPEDPIAWVEAIACLISIVLIPAVLAIAAVWVWSYQGVLSWADAGARAYAQELAELVRVELEQGRRVLTQYRPLYAATQEPLVGRPAALRASVARSAAPAASFVAAQVAECAADADNTCTLEAAALAADDALKGWSPFSSVFATDADGRREGARFTVYDAPRVRMTASYSAREYFQALRHGRGWAARDDGEMYVAQRIFSGGDGSRVLQMAVPRACPSAGEFCGVITGSLSVYGLSAAVAPSLLRFAVIDQRSGQVLFHSDDARSLAENFFVETEHEPQLRALAQLGRSGAFSGYYMGAAHRFQHAPVRDAPWSVVAFYSVREAGDVSWRAALTALAAYCAVMLLVLVVAGLVLWIGLKRSRQGVRDLAARFWHRVDSSCSYTGWGVALFGGAALVVLLYEVLADVARSSAVSVSPITWVMCALAALAWAAAHRQHRRAGHNVCIALWLLLISCAPAAWIALGHHDAQMRGLLRDALISASRDVVQRHAAIASDLRRWLADGAARAARLPDPWLLAQPSRMTPIAGFAAGECGGAGNAAHEWTNCLFGPPPLAALITKRELDFWRRETWRRAAHDEAQQRRIELLSDAASSNPSCTSAQYAEQCTLRTSDGRAATVRIDLREREQRVESADDARFDEIVRNVLQIAALGAVLLATRLLAAFASRRLLGAREPLHCSVEAHSPQPRSVVFHSRRLTQETVERILAAAGLGGGVAPSSGANVTRVNLATNALFTELKDRPLSGAVLLTNLDIALTDAARRRDILSALERLVDSRDVSLLIYSRTSPLERLYHPERFPECGADHVLSLDEALRWDNVLQKLEARDVVEPQPRRLHPHLATVDHHRVWKLSTRAERLMLYHLASGRLANPRNHAVVDMLATRGLLRFNPWPQIADPQFEAFVRTAETSRELAEWQREAAQRSGARLRTAIMTAALTALLLVVLWFSWAANDQFRMASTILAASVAFLSQIGQALNFVRNGAGRG